MISRRVVAFREAGLLFLFGISCESRGGGSGGSTLSHFTHPSSTPLLSPQAGDRLWGCGRPDYRPVPLGVGAILPLPLLFYLQDLRWGVWECMGGLGNLR